MASGYGHKQPNRTIFNMFGGKVFNNTDHEGANYGGIVNNSTFNKIGGEILDNIDSNNMYYGMSVEVILVCVGFLVVGVIGSLLFYLRNKRQKINKNLSSKNQPNYSTDTK